jgi:hypothetical protein
MTHTLCWTSGEDVAVSSCRTRSVPTHSLLHGHGLQWSQWAGDCESATGRTPEFESKTGMVSVFAYGTGRQAYFDLFMASCQRFAIEPTLLGWGQPWVGFGRKTTDIRRAINDLPGDAIVLSVDPFDVVFLTHLAELEERYRPYHGKFVCGALKLGWGLAAVYNAEFNKSGEAIPKTEFGYDHLNSGTWIANADCARSVIDRLVEQEKMTDKDMDQERLTSMYVRGDAEVALDWRCDLFHNLLFRGFPDPQAQPVRPRIRARPRA